MTDPAIPSPGDAATAGADPAIPSPLPDSPGLRAVLRAVLLDFFDTRARSLPWRETDDPYAIWVSEIMLQQTRVETVIPYWERWLDAFPDVEALAGAEEEEVLKLWEGLGYYSRARNLRRGAMVVRERFGGELPATVEALREVPGIGPYTAGAVASIAFGVATPAVDGNVRRVLARLFDEPDPTAAWLRDRAAELVDPVRPGDFNQALMELGATVCTPRSPNCTGCPVATYCGACSAGTQLERPAPRKRAPVPHRIIDLTVAICLTRGGWWAAMQRRPADGLLGGLWEFPERERDDAPAESHPLPPVEHTFSHFRATYRPVIVRLRGETLQTGQGDPDAAEAVGFHSQGGDAGHEGDARHGPNEPQWIRIDEVHRLPLPVAQQRVLALAREWIERAEVDGASKHRDQDPR